MYSMTGYGKAEYSDRGLDITVEVKSVNNRFLDINSKYPRIFIAFDEVIRKAVQSQLSRGRVDLYITYNDTRERSVDLNVDLALARSYLSAYDAIKNGIDRELDDDMTLTSLMRLPDVISQKNADSGEDLAELIGKLVTEACVNLNKMRLAEGQKLKGEILLHLGVIEKIVGEIKERAPLIQAEYRERLRERITEYLAETPVDEAKLLNEVAFFADRSNIDEEIARLYSHIAQFKKICEGEAVGRKLDFLIQEFNREANTICSKANDVILTSCGLELKSEIEKIREQIQNLE